MQKHFKLFLLLTCLGQAFYSQAQTADFRKKFEDDYTRAQRFWENNAWIVDSLCQYKVPATFAQAIVFPELIRYSALRDQMEIGGLKILYVSFGNDYADFSIGNFQMKPSFVERLMIDAETAKLTKVFKLLVMNGKDEECKRKEIVKNLESRQMQVLYLAAFYQLCEQKFKNKRWSSETEKLRFYATAYNCGYWHNNEYITNKQKQKHFSTSIMGRGNSYNYADISLYYYNSLQVEKMSHNATRVNK
ncbi:hypothetical protein [Solitalea lacus]|uniref:hypothetical protein n=1 Tax=Solitalea lacus TaxID=2911172 RepID=UPI001EDB1117|nr:hypothetical protein [Solitalea lacus]UKJ09293.1 hypothetical protein L2B55_09065 [Solitalea lacus]